LNLASLSKDNRTPCDQNATRAKRGVFDMRTIGRHFLLLIAISIGCGGVSIMDNARAIGELMVAAGIALGVWTLFFADRKKDD